MELKVESSRLCYVPQFNLQLPIHQYIYICLYEPRFINKYYKSEFHEVYLHFSMSIGLQDWQGNISHLSFSMVT